MKQKPEPTNKKAPPPSSKSPKGADAVANIAALVKQLQEALVELPDDVAALCLEPLDLAIVYHVKICSSSGVVGTVKGVQTLHEQLSDSSLSITLRQVNNVLETNIAGPVRIKVQRMVESLAEPAAAAVPRIAPPTGMIDFNAPPMMPVVKPTNSESAEELDVDGLEVQRD